MKLLRLMAMAMGLGCLFAGSSFALSSPNIPLDSPVYLYLEKLAGFGLVQSDFKGTRPYSRSEAARLVQEAEERLELGDHPPFASEIIERLKALLPRELYLRNEPESAPFFDYNPVANARLRYLYLDGAPRSYFRAAHDPGDDGVFGIGSGLRPPNPYPAPIQLRGSEGTPLSENNQGIVYRRGSNLDLRLSSEAYFTDKVSLLVEPMLQWSVQGDDLDLRLNKGYLKLGGEGLELEVGRDENWLGPGYRGNVTLTNNARNFDLVKLSSPEPVITRYLWDLKYSLLVSRFERSVTDGEVREPYFIAGRLSFKPAPWFELGLNLGRQVGGPGVDNGAVETLRGVIGGWNKDNSNSVAGFDLRFRLPWLADSEIFYEHSGEDAASFWPIAESYVAGFFVPRLTPSGRDDLRFEYFLGNNVLYANSTFPGGYLRYDLPVGHSQGGGTQEFFVRYSHWFSVRNNLAVEWIRTTRGDYGRVTVDSAGRFDPGGVLQAVERKLAWRVFWRLPIVDEWDCAFMYGHERIENWELRAGQTRTNQLVRADISYRY